MKQAALLVVVLSIVLGGGYTISIWGLSKLFFSKQARGSLIYEDNHLVGSSLIAQNNQSPLYFWPRPSASSFETIPSGASNLGPTSAALKELVQKRSEFLRSTHPMNANLPLPADLLLASGSGVDPDISPEAARFQMERVIVERKLSDLDAKEVRSLVERSIQSAHSIFSDPHVNVLLLNLELKRRFGD